MKKNPVITRSVNAAFRSLRSIPWPMYPCCDGSRRISTLAIRNIPMFTIVIIVNGPKKHKTNKVTEYTSMSLNFSDTSLSFFK